VRASGDTLCSSLGQAPGDQWCEHRLAGGSAADCVDEVLGWRVLQHVAGGAGFDCPHDRLVGVVGGHHENGDVGTSLPHRPGRFDAVHLGHPEIHQDDVRLLCQHRRECGATVGNIGNDLDVRLVLEQGDHALSHDRVVVGHHHSDRSAHGVTGSCTVRTEPRASPDSICTCPPRDSTRRVSVASPWPPVRFHGRAPSPREADAVVANIEGDHILEIRQGHVDAARLCVHAGVADPLLRRSKKHGLDRAREGLRGPDDLQFAGDVIGERDLQMTPQRIGKRDLVEFVRSTRLDESPGRVEVLLSRGFDGRECVLGVRRPPPRPSQQHDGREALGERVVDLSGHPGALLEGAT
jgi:hypothetical protein